MEKYDQLVVILKPLPNSKKELAKIAYSTSATTLSYRRRQNFGANQKLHAMTSSEIFERGTFYGTKIS